MYEGTEGRLTADNGTVFAKRKVINAVIVRVKVEDQGCHRPKRTKKFYRKSKTTSKRA